TSDRPVPTAEVEQDPRCVTGRQRRLAQQHRSARIEAICREDPGGGGEPVGLPADREFDLADTFSDFGYRREVMVRAHTTHCHPASTLLVPYPNGHYRRLLCAT